MSTLRTPLTRLLGIRTPIVLAPMAGASGGALASEVSLAGGFGFFAPSPVYAGLENFRNEFAIARSTLNQPSGPLPLGAGFLGWKLEGSADLGRWVEFVRSHDEKYGKTPKTLIFVQVNSVDEALHAAQAWKVDVPWIESGGHGSASSPPVLNLVPQIVSALPPFGAPPVLAAGGLSDGAHLAAFLTLGAAGAVESLYSDVQKRAIIAAKSGSAYCANTTGWPAGTDGRALAMPAVAAVESGADITAIKEEVAEGAKRGDPSSVIAWAGTGVGRPNRLQPAKVTTDYLRRRVLDFEKG
ncbi:inosine monophosphate dehydrogenase [Lactarius psammicola]|nr:inosine monophosphate dehydrogenase [Lactarius psammicola]